MTEAEWLVCKNPFDVANDHSFRFGEKWARKLRLVACACCRRVWHRITDERSRQAVEYAERFAEGTIDNRKLEEAHQRGCEVVREVGILHPVHAAAYTATPLAGHAAYFAFQDAHEEGESFECKSQWQMALVRDVLGNPFRPVALDSAWLTSNVTALAQSVYDDRAFDHLPILADALEDAGCDNADILNHCRQPAEHVRGCWVVDLILGKV
jgi:hypothetical protein